MEMWTAIVVGVVLAVMTAYLRSLANRNSELKEQIAEKAPISECSAKIAVLEEKILHNELRIELLSKENSKEQRRTDDVLKKMSSDIEDIKRYIMDRGRRANDTA